MAARGFHSAETFLKRGDRDRFVEIAEQHYLNRTLCKQRLPISLELCRVDFRHVRRSRRFPARVLVAKQIFEIALQHRCRRHFESCHSPISPTPWRARRAADPSPDVRAWSRSAVNWSARSSARVLAANSKASLSTAKFSSIRLPLTIWSISLRRSLPTPFSREHQRPRPEQATLRGSDCLIALAETHKHSDLPALRFVGIEQGPHAIRQFELGHLQPRHRLARSNRRGRTQLRQCIEAERIFSQPRRFARHHDRIQRRGHTLIDVGHVGWRRQHHSRHRSRKQSLGRCQQPFGGEFVLHPLINRNHGIRARRRFRGYRPL